MPYVKMDWRKTLIETICPKCAYYEFCMLDHDCEAFKILVKVNENMVTYDTDFTGE